MSPSNLEKIEHWVKGPEFLWKEESRRLQSKQKEINDISDFEVKKKAAVNVSKIEEDIVSILQIRLSSWKDVIGGNRCLTNIYRCLTDIFKI